MDFRPIFLVLGLLVAALGLVMFIPAIADLVADHEDWRIFTASGFATLLIGALTMLANRGGPTTLTVRQAFLLTTLAWVALAAFGALPFVFSHLGLSYAEAYFEAMSGLTTTGATVIVGLDEAPPGILLWRALLHGVGGIGIVVMAVAVLPFLRVGGMQLFRMESSDKSEKLMPKAAQMALAIILVYFGLAILCTLALWLAGMNAFDAVCHALATVSTGGFSTKDASVGYFDSDVIDWILVVFMLSGGLPLTYYVRVLGEGWGAARKESQPRTFLSVVAVIVVVLSLWAWQVADYPLDYAFHHVAFSVASIITTTGFVTVDYSEWGDAMMLAMLLVTCIGGCTGSTSGGIKIFRWQILLRYIRAQLSLMFQPNRVITLRYDQTAYTPEVTLSVITFIAVYFVSMGGLSMLVALTGVDFLSALSGTAAAMANVGPGLGKVVGPAGTYQPVPEATKWLLSVAMLIGRLEIFTILVLFTRNFWRR
ncbi:MAG: TrkH family potassium uptake protein [Rhodospirillales bacterium]|nr:TrkH family potassium uptake protein [Rhodospirillales bacterium]